MLALLDAAVSFDNVTRDNPVSTGAPMLDVIDFPATDDEDLS
ncbi:MAG TPA: hypothetical protein VGN60_11020 [Devosia sp.]|jgi:hypothetical protein|nr:hypothetical protein [Devosia sp.]